MGHHEGTLQIEYDDISMRTKLILTRFERNFVTLRLNEKAFFKILLGFPPFWDYKPTNTVHVDSLAVYTTEKFITLSTIDKIHMKCEVIDDSAVNGLR